MLYVNVVIPHSSLLSSLTLNSQSNNPPRRLSTWLFPVETEQFWTLLSLPTSHPFTLNYERLDSPTKWVYACCFVHLGSQPHCRHSYISVSWKLCVPCFRSAYEVMCIIPANAMCLLYSEGQNPSNDFWVCKDYWITQEPLHLLTIDLDPRKIFSSLALILPL